jgi:LmbE family N-acetylglucosaminyl deacetylase
MRMRKNIPPKRSLQPSHRLLRIAAAGVCLLAARPDCGVAAETQTNAVILQELRSFREMGSVLYIAAHPDDENTQLITYLARGRGYRMAYLSVTRGDGGQNLLGSEFDEELGVIRTQELLAARRLDGGRQFFTRAIDFGYSKDYRETLGIWDRDKVLGDVVRVIRTFQPDVVVAGFSPQQTPGQHGHHVASAVLAVDAFKLAGDPKAYPEQLDKLKPWQPKRLLQNIRFGGNRGGNASPDLLRIEAGGNDPVSGESFGSIAGRSRAMHKSQGFGNFGGGGGSAPQSFQLLDGEPATNDIMDGIDTTWARVPGGGAEIGKLTDEAIEKFNTNDPVTNVPALLAIRSRVIALPADRIVDEKRRQLDRVIQACLGLSVETTVTQAEVVPGEELQLHHSATIRSWMPVRWQATRYPGIQRDLSAPIELIPGQTVTRDSTETLPARTPLSQPYWLREERTTGTYQVSVPSLIGQPENPPAFPVEEVFEVGGQTMVIADEPVQLATGSVPEAWKRRRLEVIPPVSLKFASDVKLFAPGAANTVEVEVTAARPNATGTLELDAPAGWKFSPASQPFKLETVGGHARFKFTVTAPKEAATARIAARAKIGGSSFNSQRVEIRYPHIPPLLLQPPATVKVACLDLAIRGKNIGYLPGAGDSVAQTLEQMGYAVTLLTGADLTTNRLKDFDAVVIGIRAFNVRTDLVSQLPDLFAYVESGGTVVAQYNRPGGDLKTDKLAPYSLRLSNDRVTDEHAAMTFLAPDHPVLNTPNKITSADFDGWIQERGVYFPNQWDEHFTPILSCSDPGESVPKTGSLLIARYGKGYFVYTGLAFFRQLPDGVPGAYRLFANLVSLGK